MVVRRFHQYMGVLCGCEVLPSIYVWEALPWLWTTCSSKDTFATKKVFKSKTLAWLCAKWHLEGEALPKGSTSTPDCLVKIIRAVGSIIHRSFRQFRQYVSTCTKYGVENIACNFIITGVAVMAIIDADCSCKLHTAVCSLLNLHAKCALSMMNKEILCPKRVASLMDDMDNLASTLSSTWCMIRVYSAVQLSTRAWVRESVQQWQIGSRYTYTAHGQYDLMVRLMKTLCVNVLPQCVICFPT